MDQPTGTDQEFTDAELWTLRETLRERYGRDVEVQFGEAEMRLSRLDRQLTACPVVAWTDGWRFAARRRTVRASRPFPLRC